MCELSLSACEGFCMHVRVCACVRVCDCVCVLYVCVCMCHVYAPAYVCVCVCVYVKETEGGRKVKTQSISIQPWSIQALLEYADI